PKPEGVVGHRMEQDEIIKAGRPECTIKSRSTAKWKWELPMKISAPRIRVTSSIVMSPCLLLASYLGGQTDNSTPLAGSDANNKSVTDPGPKVHDDSFQIGADDVLAINVWREPEISRSVPVRSDGKVSLPLVGEVQASGQTPKQLEAEISKKLV